MRRLFASLIVSLLLVLLAASTALGASPANPDCWGVVTAQRATALHDIGTHASSQETPRLGLGNFARLLFDLGLTAGPHISDAASVAAELDGISETSCP